MIIPRVLLMFTLFCLPAITIQGMETQAVVSSTSSRLQAYIKSLQMKDEKQLLPVLQQLARAIYIQEEAIGHSKNVIKAIDALKKINERLNLWLPVPVSDANAAQISQELIPYFPKNVTDVLTESRIGHAGIGALEISRIPSTEEVEDKQEYMRPIHPTLERYCPKNTISTLEGVAFILSCRDLILAPDVTRENVQSILPYLTHENSEVRAIAEFIRDKKAGMQAMKQKKDLEEEWIYFYKDFSSTLTNQIQEPKTPLNSFSSELQYVLSLNQQFEKYFLVLLKQKTTQTLTEEFTEEDKEYVDSMKALFKQYEMRHEELQALYQEVIAHIAKIITSQPTAIKKMLYGYKQLVTKDVKSFPSSLSFITPKQVHEHFEFTQESEIQTSQEILESFKIQPTKTAQTQKTHKKKKSKRKKESQQTAYSDKEEIKTEALSQASQTINSDIEDNMFSITIKSPSADFVLYKITRGTRAPLTIPSITYHTRVQEWFMNPQEALKNQGYTDKNHKNFADKKYHPAIIYRHAFPRAIDAYLATLAIPSPWVSRNNQIQKGYCIPGEIHFKNEQGNVAFIDGVVFVYTLDEQNICYHRCATIKPVNALVAEYMAQGHWNVHYDEEFPPLGTNQ